MSIVEKIKNLAANYAADTISFRRHLHSNPELSFEEYNTSKFVAEKLRSFGVETTEGVATTGVVGLIKVKIQQKEQ